MLGDDNQQQGEPSSGQGRKKRRRELPCHLCDRVFHKNEHLNRHIVSHTKEKSFRCNICSKIYGRRDSLLRHAKIHNEAGEPQCQQGYATTPEAAPPLPTTGERRSQRLRIASHAAAAESYSNTSPPFSVTNLSFAPFRDRGQDGADIVMNVSPELGDSQQRHLDGQISIEPEQYDAVPSNIQHYTSMEEAGVTSNTENPDALPNLDYWNPGVAVHDPPWLLGSEFDFTALTNSISASLPNWALSTHSVVSQQDESQDHGPDRSQLSPQTSHSGVRSIVEELWLTRPVATTSPSYDIGIYLPQDKLDENYRSHLTRRLKPSLRDGVLPPANFLNLCIKLFFTKFNPVFPLIHASTFRPSSENALLVISICSIGALFVGTTRAAAQGREIFLRLNKAILASWETYVYKRGPESLSIAQAVVLGQTFGMLAGDSNDLLLTNSFHGTIIAWARQAGMFQIKRAEDTLRKCDSANVDEMWKAWVHAEETIRVVAGLHIHDCEFTTFFHTDPFLRHGNTETLPHCCSDELFCASTATTWQATLQQHQNLSEEQMADDRRASGDWVRSTAVESRLTTSKSYLTSYVFLSSKIASISEAKSATTYSAQMPAFSQQLQAWWLQNQSLCDKTSPCGFLTVLWHEAFIVLYTDLDLLERQVGRDGDGNDLTQSAPVWLNSSQAACAVLHAYLSLKYFENATLSLEPAIYVPKTLFHSGMVIYMYLKRCQESGCVTDTPIFQDSELVGLPGLPTAEACQAILQTVDISTLSSIVDILRRLGHWQISRRMALIIEALVDAVVMSARHHVA